MKDTTILKSILVGLVILCSTTTLYAQITQKIGNNSFIVNSKAVLELESVTKGFLPPRLSVSQQTALGTSLPQGLLIYVIDGAHEGIQLWDGTKWIYYIDSAALALKANLESPNFTGIVGGISATMVGLGDVNNTSDLSKPISTATLTALDTKVDKVLGERLINAAEITKLGNQSGINTGDQNLSSFATNSNLDLKANIASPTFTGTVYGINKTMVGLGNVDNTTDLNKQISTATQNALNTKEDLSNKITDINSDPTSITKYPTVSAVKNYVDSYNPIHSIKTIETDYTAERADYTILCNNVSAAFTITLPDPGELTGKIYVIRKIDETINILTINPVLKLTELTEISSLNYPKTIRVQSNGRYWYVID